MWGSVLAPLGLCLLAHFLFPSGAQGSCGPPPKLKNAIPLIETDGKSFPLFHSVTYKCLDGFYNIHGKLDVTTCISDSQWTPIEEFCEPSCSRPPKFKFAKIKPGERRNYFPAETKVNYICSPGYVSIPGINSSVTCLENYTWTALPFFCEGKSCGDPGEPKHGGAVILTNFLFMAKVNFTCDEGYRLIGSPSTECILKGDEVEWKTKPPECRGITELSTPMTFIKNMTTAVANQPGMINMELSIFNYISPVPIPRVQNTLFTGYHNLFHTLAHGTLICLYSDASTYERLDLRTI